MRHSDWALLQSLSSTMSQEQFESFSRFRARAKFTRDLSAITAGNQSAALTEGYFVVLRLALSYSAFECLDAATGRSQSLHITHSGLLNSIRRGEFNDLLLIQKSASPPSKRQVVEKYQNLLISGETENLLQFVELCRHLMFHGAFTPSGSKMLGSKKRRDYIYGLSDIVLDSADEFAHNWLLSQRTKINNKENKKR